MPITRSRRKDRGYLMNIWAITTVKNEEDIIGYNLSHLDRQGLDGIIVADNMSNDETDSIIGDMARIMDTPVVYFQDEELAHYQGRKMTELADMAANDFGADFIIPFDADELWYSVDRRFTLGESIRRHYGKEVLAAGMINHYRGTSDVDSINPFVRFCYRDERPNSMHKIAFHVGTDRNFRINEGNHSVSINGEVNDGEFSGIAIRHFPYRSEDQFILKVRQGARALALTDLDPSIGSHWRQFGADLMEKGKDHMKEHYRKNFTYLNPEMRMIYDPAPYMGDL